MNFKVYHVRQGNVGEPLATMLRRILPGRSWSEVKKVVIGRKVQVNGNLCTDETRRMKAGDIVKIFDEAMARPVSDEHLVIRHQDEHVIVVEKPAGLTTQRHVEEAHWDDARKNRQPTLEELLQRIIDRHGVSRMPGRGTNNKLAEDRRQIDKRFQKQELKLTVRAVHRLDRDTSGLMIFALSHAAEQKVVQMFAAHSIQRAYLAVVAGQIKGPQTIKTKITRDRGDGLRGSLPPGKDAADAKDAITHLKPVKALGDYTLIECRLETGRTHQIRIHLAEIGHILAGETTYNRPLGCEPIPDKSGAPRQALHAYRLEFDHPITGERMKFEQKMPPDFRKLVKRLKPDGDAGDAPGEGASDDL